MDLRTGKTYDSLAEALKDGVPVSDVAQVEQEIGKEPRVKFAKHKPFKSFQNAGAAQADGDHGEE